MPRLLITAGTTPIAVGNGRVSPPVTLLASASKTLDLSPDQFDELVPLLDALGSAKVTYIVIDGRNVTMRFPLASGGVTGTADDVILIAAGALPHKLRVLNTTLLVTGVIAASTLTLRDQAAGAGTVLSKAFSGAAAARLQDDSTATFVSAVPAAAVGLFVHRSDRAVVGEIVVQGIWEQ